MVGEVSRCQRAAGVSGDGEDEVAVQPQRVQEARGEGSSLGVLAAARHGQVAVQGQVLQARDDQATQRRQHVQQAAQRQQQEQVEQVGEAFAVHLSSRETPKKGI